MFAQQRRLLSRQPIFLLSATLLARLSALRIMLCGLCGLLCLSCLHGGSVARYYVVCDQLDIRGCEVAEDGEVICVKGGVGAGGSPARWEGWKGHCCC